MSEVSSAPISVPSPVPSPVPDKMAAVRQAKKRKAQEDRDTLSDLKQKVSNLADSMSSKPEVVTRPQKDEESSLPSMSTEFFRTALVGLLGLSTFYVSNVWAKRPKLMAPTPTPPTPAPAPHAAPTPTPPVVKASPTTFIDLKPTRKKVGASGLLE